MDFLLPQEVLFIIDTLNSHNFDAYAVGGCVRDTLLCRIPKDWDITTNALPEDIIKSFKHTVPTGIKHGTVTVIIGKQSYEVTTYRIDGKYTDNRHPDQVVFTNSLEEDLSRRDFTINAMAFNSLKSLQDPFNGTLDLKNKLIKCVGNPTLRFTEDALRMLRAIRFSAELKFTIEENTLQALSTNCKLINNVSFERIHDELCKILLSDVPSTGIRLLETTGLLNIILPELNECVGFNQRNPYHNKDVFEHTLAVLDNTTSDLILRLSALLHDIGKPKCFSADEKGIGHFYMHNIKSSIISQEILGRLRFDNNTIRTVNILIKEHLSCNESLSPSAVKKLINRVGIDNLDKLFELQAADIKAHKPPHDFTKLDQLKFTVKDILNSKQAFSIKQLEINGSDLIKLGYPQGIIIGETLKKILDLVLENPDLNSKEKLLELAKNMLS